MLKTVVLLNNFVTAFICEIEIFCNNRVFTVTFDQFNASMLNKRINLLISLKKIKIK